MIKSLTEGKTCYFLVRAYTKPKLLTGNKLWRAHSRYDEFFVWDHTCFVIKTDEIGISPAFLSWWAIIAHLLVNNSRSLEWTSLSHVSPMTSYMWLLLGLAAHLNLAYSYHTIRRATWSTQKPCRTEESIMLLEFIFHWQWKGHLIYINRPMYPLGKAGYLCYLLLLNHPNKSFI